MTIPKIDKETSENAHVTKSYALDFRVSCNFVFKNILQLNDNFF